MSGLNRESSKDLQRDEKIESLARGLEETFGPRAEDIARKQCTAATAGSETAEVWRRILAELTSPARSFPHPGDGTAAAEPLQP